MHDFRTDAELAGRGDTAAFSRLYSLVYKDMYRTALYNLRNTHDAADAVSDAVADAFENIGRLKNAEAFKAWIMKILFAKIKKRQYPQICGAVGSGQAVLRGRKGYGYAL